MGCEKQREATVHIQSLVKLQHWFLNLRWKTGIRQNCSLGSSACSEGPALGQNTLMIMNLGLRPTPPWIHSLNGCELDAYISSMSGPPSDKHTQSQDRDWNPWLLRESNGTARLESRTLPTTLRLRTPIPSIIIIDNNNSSAKLRKWNHLNNLLAEVCLIHKTKRQKFRPHLSLSAIWPV